MKITCEYCGSYVEPTKEGKCPACSAAIGDSTKTQEEKTKRKIRSFFYKNKKSIKQILIIAGIIFIILLILKLGHFGGVNIEDVTKIYF